MDKGEARTNWRMVDALIEFQAEKDIYFSGFLLAFAQPGGKPANILYYRKIAWDALRPRLEAGDFTGTGFLPNTRAPEQIHPAFFRNAVPDFEADTLELNGTKYAAVRLSRASNCLGDHLGQIPPEEIPSSLRARRAKYEQCDMTLFPEWRERVAKGEDPYPAAQALAHKAAGGGTLESKAKRLHVRFSRLISSTRI